MDKDLKSISDIFNKELKDAVLSCDLWETKNSKSLQNNDIGISISSNFGDLFKKLDIKLETLGLPIIGNYAIVDLEMNTYLLFIKLDDNHILGSLLDKSKVVFGSLLHVVIPKLIKAYKELQ